MSGLSLLPLRRYLSVTRSARNLMARWSTRREWRIARAGLWSNESACLHVTNALIVAFMYWRTGYTEADIFPRYTAGWMLCMFWTFFPFIASAETLSEGVLV